MSGKKLERNNTLRHKKKLKNVRKLTEQNIRKKNKALAKLRFYKVWLSNYPLFVALPILIIATTLAIVKTSLNLRVLVIGFSLFLYLFLLFANHHERIEKDEEPTVNDYKSSSMFLSVISKVGLLYAGIIITIIIMFQA